LTGAGHRTIYFDWNATTPPLAEVIDAMREAAREAWGNPSSIHGTGRAARAQVESAREAVAELVGADPRDVVLTSGGTEANNLAIRSAFAEMPRDLRRVLITSRLEHPSVTRVAEALEREGAARVLWVVVREDGRLDLDSLDAALADADVGLVTVQAVNHETGVVQPVSDVIRKVGTHARNPHVHVDAVQAFGRLDVATIAQADTIALAGHKIRGPKGIGALVARLGVRLSPLMFGGAQERGLRPGTLDPVAAAGLAVAARHARTSAPRYLSVAPLRDKLEARLVALGGRRVGTAPRAPHVANLAFGRWPGAELVAAFDLEGLAVSSGSACSAGTIEPSPVVTSMLGAELARSCVRFSLGEDATLQSVDAAIAIAERVLGR